MTSVLGRPRLSLVAPLDQAPVRDEPTPAPAPKAPAEKGRFRADIQGLRAVAILLVVLYHSKVPGIRAGYVGVDVFFVISGFLITRQMLGEIARTGRLAIGRFFARRMRRLLPAALLVVTVTVLVARYWGPPLQLRSTAKDALFTALYSINFRLAAEGVNYQQADGPQSPLQHFWSLAVEEQFYVLWPFVLIVALLIARKRFYGLALVLLVAATAASFYASVIVTRSSAPTAYFSVQTRAWEFGVGALIAFGAGRLAGSPRVVRRCAGWIGLGLIVGSAIYYDDATPFPGSAALAPVLGCGLVIAAGCGSELVHSTGVILDRGPMQFIGRVSYSWYLWHWPVLILAPAVLGQNLSWIRNCELDVLTLWVAALTYVAVELPMLHGTLRPGRWAIRGLGLSASVAAFALVISLIAPNVGGSGRFAAPVSLTGPNLTALTNALQQASTSHTVPGNLTPSLTHAATDVPVTQSGCHLDFLQVKEGPCVYGDPNGTKTMVLYGDSHAQQWQGALDAAAKALHWKLVAWTKAACPVADLVITSPDLKRRYTECEQFRADTVDQINALHPALVIASQSDSVPGEAVTNVAWADQTAVTLSKLRHAGTNVLFLADTPYPQVDIPTCIAAHLSDIRPCELSRQNGYRASAYYAQRHALMMTTLRGAGITVVDPINWLCSATLCPVIVGNELVYRDASHLSNTFSVTLGPILELVLTNPALVPVTS